MIKRILTLFLTVVLFLSLTTISCSKKEEEVKSKYQANIGVAVVLTGDLANWGKMAQKGIEIVKEIKEKEYGKKVNIVYEDTKGQTKEAISTFQKLVNSNKSSVVLGDMLSSTTLAMAPLANKYHVPLIGISCSAPAVTHAGEYVYRVWPSDIYEGGYFGEWVYKHGFRHLAIVYINNEYGIGLKNSFKKSYKGKVLIEIPFNENTLNFRQIAIQLAPYRNKLDGIYIVGYYDNTARIIKTIREHNIDVQIFGTSSTENHKLLEIAGKYAEGVIYPVVDEFFGKKLNPFQQEFFNKFKQKYGIEPDWAATHGGDAAVVALDCILKFNAKTGEEIKKCIDSQREFDGVTGKIVFDENGDVIEKQIVIKTIKGGKFIYYELER